MVLIFVLAIGFYAQDIGQCLPQTEVCRGDHVLRVYEKLGEPAVSFLLEGSPALRINRALYVGDGLIVYDWGYRNCIWIVIRKLKVVSIEVTQCRMLNPG